MPDSLFDCAKPQVKPKSEKRKGVGGALPQVLAHFFQAMVFAVLFTFCWDEQKKNKAVHKFETVACVPFIYIYIVCVCVFC